jgi:betaine-aldehyde dehydrogenase
MTKKTQALKLVNRVWTHFIDGGFAFGGSKRTLFNPADGKPLTTVAEADAEQVDAAIAAARKAFDEGEWPRMPAAKRAELLFKLADRLDQQVEKLAVLETLNCGKPLRESRADVGDIGNCFRYYAGLITKPTGQTMDVPAPSMTMVVREPIGVCAQIIPWNFPIQMVAWKLAPALAAGNCCILKPSEYTPLTAIRVAEELAKLGLPKGVLNVVLGGGAIGSRLAESHLVDKVAFTGSVKTGKLVAAAALGNLKRVTLELGGKSPFIVFSDADIELAVDHALFAIFCNSGQVCSAGSRFLIEDSIHDRFLERFVERSRTIRLGSGLDPRTEMGPLVSEQQMKRVLEYIEIGKKEGAKLVLGGDRPNGAGARARSKFADGYYVNPTIFCDVHQSMRIVQEEIFGPVAVVQKFSSEQEAIALANGTIFGLAGAVFTNDVTRAMRMVKAIRAGVTWVNHYHNTYNEVPWGGYKQSGWGRELGTYGLDAYMEIKQININLDPQKVGWIEEK